MDLDVWSNIKELIAEKQLKKADFSKKMDISRQTLDNWINGTTSPTQKDLDKMSTIFDELQLKTSKDPEDIYRNIVEGNTEYILIPRTVLQEKYRLVAIEQINKDQAYLQGQFEIIQSLFAQLNRLGLNPADIKKA
jgi:transcriptional regulator with XRE-family HTH domain